MQAIDYLLLAVIAGSVAFGVIRGFFREALSLVTWIAAVWIAWEFSDLTRPLLRDMLAQPSAQLWVGRFMLFIVILLLGSLAGWGVSKLVQHSGLSGVDRVLGMGFGFGRGILIMGLLVLIGQALSVDQETWWEDSRLVPYGARVAESIRGFLEDGGVTLDMPQLEPPAADSIAAASISGV